MKKEKRKNTNKKILKIFGYVFGGFFLLLIIVSCFNNDTDNFEQIGYYKAKMDNGSYNRVFSIFVSKFEDTSDNWDAIENYAKNLMYSANGNTNVWFFNNKNHTPDVTFVGMEFDSKYEPYCIAQYQKNFMGDETFLKYPFKK